MLGRLLYLRALALDELRELDLERHALERQVAAIDEQIALFAGGRVDRAPDADRRRPDADRLRER